MNNLTFNYDRVGGCCGTICFYNLQNSRDTSTTYNKRHNVFDLDITKAVQTKCTNIEAEGAGQLGTITLITKYKEVNLEQDKELHQHLLATDWKAVNVFVNGNTGNEVTLFTKFFEVNYQEDCQAEDDWDDEEEDSDF